MTVDSIALPIQLDAPIVCVDEDGREYRIQAAAMVNGELRLTIAPDDPAAQDDTELYGAGSE
jgi:hypothetical protein